MNRKDFLLFSSSLIHQLDDSQAIKPESFFPIKDPRLDKPISFVDSAIWLGDLCAKLTELSGVEIRCTDKRNGDGEKLFVALKQVPLSDVLESLWSLNSYRRARWEWQQTKSGDVLVYTLERSSNAARLHTDLSNDIQARFEDFLERKINTSKLSDSEIERLANSGDRVAQDLQKEAYLLSGLRLIGSRFSMDQLKSVSRSSARQTVPKNQLSSNQLQEADKIWKRMRVTNSDGSQPDFASISIYSHQSYLSPSIVISLGSEDGGVGYPYTGDDSFGEDINTEFPRGWLLTGDSTDIPAAPYTPSRNQDNLTLLMILNQLIEKSDHISLMGHVPKTRVSTRVARQANENIFTYFKNTTRRNEPMFKTRKNILLISYPNWFLKDAHQQRVPLKLFKGFEAKALSKKTHPLNLADVADAALYLTPEGLSHYEDMFSQFRAAIQWQTYLAWARDEKRWASAIGQAGVPVSVALRTQLLAVPHFASVSLPNELWLRFREESEPKHWALYMELLDKRGRVLTSAKSEVAPLQTPP